MENKLWKSIVFGMPLLVLSGWGYTLIQAVHVDRLEVAVAKMGKLTETITDCQRRMNTSNMAIVDTTKPLIYMGDNKVEE